MTFTLRLLGLVLPTMLFATAAPLHAQYSITWFTIDGGGGTSSSATFTLSGTIGQCDAGSSSAETFTLAGGFWPNAVTAPTPPCSVDFNNDGFTEPGDLDEFITSFFSDNEAERSACDFNGDGFVEPGDLDEFITAFFEGC
ncbi:MAG: EF-hand domain-containing protein [Phycisphaerales bacterium]